MPRFPPMGGEPYWEIDWDAFEQAYRADHPDTWGFERAEFYDAMFELQRVENSDPATWPEIGGVSERE